MRISNSLLMKLLCLAVLVLLPMGLLAKGVKVEVEPSKSNPTKGEKITLAVNIDVSETSELLGAVSATLTWNKDVLRYVNHTGGSAKGFSSPVINAKDAADGRLNFVGINPYGSANDVNVLNIQFEIVGEAGVDAAVQLDINELYAARSFNDLMPALDSKTVNLESGLQVAEVPKEFTLHQNYPNPFNAGTVIKYDLPESSQVTLAIYNSIGMRVRTLVDGSRDAGEFNAKWDGKDDHGSIVATGLYIYRIKAGKFQAEKSMMFIK